MILAVEQDVLPGRIPFSELVASRGSRFRNTSTDDNTCGFVHHLQPGECDDTTFFRAHLCTGGLGGPKGGSYV